MHWNKLLDSNLWTKAQLEQSFKQSSQGGGSSGLKIIGSTDKIFYEFLRCSDMVLKAD